jgi:hypothetical protein
MMRTIGPDAVCASITTISALCARRTRTYTFKHGPDSPLGGIVARAVRACAAAHAPNTLGAPGNYRVKFAGGARGSTLTVPAEAARVLHTLVFMLAHAESVDVGDGAYGNTLYA